MEMEKYQYAGPVLEFGKLLTDRWEATTFAVSEAKARSNFVYQFKRKCNRCTGTRISLPGKVVRV